MTTRGAERIANDSRVFRTKQPKGLEMSNHSQRSDPEGLRAGVERLIAECLRVAESASAEADEAMRLDYLMGGAPEYQTKRWVAIERKNINIARASQLRALLAKHPPTPLAAVHCPSCGSPRPDLFKVSREGIASHCADAFHVVFASE